MISQDCSCHKACVYPQSLGQLLQHSWPGKKACNRQCRLSACTIEAHIDYLMMQAGASTLVGQYSAVFQDLLALAQEIKPNGDIDPALDVDEFADCVGLFNGVAGGAGLKHFAAVETACRDIFYTLLASNSIEDQAFGDVWNLFDIVSSLSDQELCEPGLIFWLVEELLDSQTIDGCRIVFDYLDSRRDRLTAKHFEKKNLIILRSCNELLRRLSRAEDTVFCGRVFIFLFQSFPLGDKSSVNLRGEYHVENVTILESVMPAVEEVRPDSMDVDQEARQEIHVSDATNEEVVPSLIVSDEVVNIDDQTRKTEGPARNSGQLYEVFWSLQQYFSRPTTLFDDRELQTFKDGLHATIKRFKEVQHDNQAKGPAKILDGGRRGGKRKRDAPDNELSNAFNPKYLTSRDLFELEISDLAFRRHILVQSLILLDFLLSLSPKAKRKLATASNKSVLYAYVLGEDNIRWATSTRNDIASYLQQGPEGKFYYRMVDTVLSRDKNWTHWKAEACPPIARPAISGENFHDAMRGAQKACTSKRLRPIPLGTMDLKFLADSSGNDVMEKLRLPERYSVPTAESFERPLADDDFEIDMCKNDAERVLAEEARASKLWRALRVASKSQLRRFDKIEDGKNMKALFEVDREPEPEPEVGQLNEEQANESKLEGANGESDAVPKGVENHQQNLDDQMSSTRGLGKSEENAIEVVQEPKTSTERAL